jgi:hypothetical protein
MSRCASSAPDRPIPHPAAGPSRRGLLGAAAASILLAGCGSGGDGPAPAPVPTVPTLTIEGSVVGVAAGPVDVSFRFSDAVGAFGADRFLVNGGRVVAGSFVMASPREYTVQIAPFEGREGSIEVEVFPTAFRDATGTVSNTLAYRFSQPYDTRRPEPWVTWSDSQPGLFASGALTVTITFSEDVGTSFEPDDLFVTGATVSDFTRVSATVYTVVATPLPGARLMTIELPAGAVSAAVPNGLSNSRPWEWVKLLFSS